MIRILLVDDEADLRDVLSFFLETEFGAVITPAGSVAEAKLALCAPVPYDLVVCDYALGDGTAEDVFEHLRRQGSTIPFVLCSAYHPDTYPRFRDQKIDTFIPKLEIFQGLKDYLNATLSPRKRKGGFPEYFGIRTETLLKVGILSCDFYLRMQQDHYVRVLREGDHFNAEDLRHFKEKNVTQLYLRAADRVRLLQTLTQDLLKLSALRSEPIEKVFEISSSALEIVAEFTQRFGMTEETKELVRANVSLAVKNIQKHEVLGPIFEKLMVDPDHYLASHSAALAWFCCGIADVMNWKSEMTFYRLTMAAFLHDILLSNPRLAEIQTLTELNEKADQFSPDEMREFLNHPQACASLLRDLKDIPMEVDVIIFQHHERPDGTGFPAHLNHLTVSPLSAVFIVAHELLQFHYHLGPKHCDSPRIVKFLGALPEDYSRGYFRNIVKAVIEALERRRSADSQ